jgi:hypothetical protein
MDSSNASMLAKSTSLSASRCARRDVGILRRAKKGGMDQDLFEPWLYHLLGAFLFSWSMKGSLHMAAVPKHEFTLIDRLVKIVTP